MVRTPPMAGKERSIDIQPQLIQDTHWGLIKSHALSTAIELDLFSILHAGNHTLEKIAKALGAPLRSTRILLDALVGIGILGKNRGLYKLEAEAKHYLVRDEPNYLGNSLKIHEKISQAWFALTRSVKEGKPIPQSLDGEARKQFFCELVKIIFPTSYASSVILCKKLGVGKTLKVKKILDIGCGAAPWSIGFALADNQSQIVAFDYPEVIEIAKQYTKRFHVHRQYEFESGDYHHADFSGQTYDIIILGQICHMEGEVLTRKIFKKCFDALNPGGKLLVAEFLANDLRTGPPIPLLFGLNMLLFSEHGDVYTAKDVKRWLDFAGFKKVSAQAVQYPATVLVASK